MKVLLILLAFDACLRAEIASMKIVSSKVTSSENGKTVITFTIKNISEKTIQLGHEVGSKGKIDTNIRLVFDREDYPEGSSFWPYSPNMISKACHGQTFFPVDPGQVVPVQLHLYDGFFGKKLALVLTRKDGASEDFVVGTFIAP